MASILKMINEFIQQIRTIGLQVNISKTDALFINKTAEVIILVNKETVEGVNNFYSSRKTITLDYNVDPELP